MRLGFAALHQLLLPFLDEFDALPPLQARALRSAFGLGDEAAPDLFLVGLATLTLLAAAAAPRGLLVVVDDAQWLDQETADVLGFVGRRLYADRIVLLVALRDPSQFDRSFEGLPHLRLEPLPEAAARELLDASVNATMADDVRAQILLAAAGNPLALLELGHDLSAQQLAGVELLPEPLPVSHHLEARFLRSMLALPADSQRLLLAVAAEPTGDIPLILRAGRDLGFDERAFDAATEAALLTVGATIGFRHPVIRSAVYQGASEPERRRTHAALATATNVDRDPDRRAWHRAVATAVPDEEVAEELEAAGARAQSHGRHAAASALFERAAELTPERDRRALRLLVSAFAALTAGNSAHAHHTVSRAIDDLDDPILLAQARRLQAGAQFLDSLPEASVGQGSPRRHEEIMKIMLDTVDSVAPVDIHLARETILDAIPMAVYFSGLTTTTVQTASRVALSLPLPAGAVPTSTDLVLDALATLFVHGSGPAVAGLRRCLDALQADPGLPDLPRTMALGCWVAFALGDDEAVRNMAHELVMTSRERGVLQFLPESLNYLGQCELRAGSLAAADAYFAEQREIDALSRRNVVAEVSQLTVAAWRGREDGVRSAATHLVPQVTELSIGLLFNWIEYAFIVLELGLGNYKAAARRKPGELGDDVSLGPFKAADEIEAHSRGGSADVAAARLKWLSDRALANESPLELGLLARCRALLADNDAAEHHHSESIGHLSASGATLHLARTQLLYGEWLRRQKRRRDAREQLEAALGTFEAAGADAFARRARLELLATGITARKRVDETRSDLTSQEEQIARLAATGATNPEIATRLFISPSTVDYHLRKVYRKLGIASRRELARTAYGSD